MGKFHITMLNESQPKKNAYCMIPCTRKFKLISNDREQMSDCLGKGVDRKGEGREDYTKAQENF